MKGHVFGGYNVAVPFNLCHVFCHWRSVTSRHKVIRFRFLYGLAGRRHITSTGLMYNEFTFEILFSFYGYIWVVKMCPSVTLTMAGLKTDPNDMMGYSVLNLLCGPQSI